ncbi:hypothetical protein ABK424_003894 [Escherichia coli]
MVQLVDLACCVSF